MRNGKENWGKGSRFLSRKLNENLTNQIFLRNERNNIPFTKEASTSLKQLIDSFKSET